MPEERPLQPFVKESPEPADFADPRLVQLLEHWNELRGEAATPPSQAIDATRLGFILGWLMIMVPLDAGADFQYRLYGSSIARAVGRDLTGFKVSDSFPSFAAWTTEVYRTVMARRLPMLTRHAPQRFLTIDHWERLILPFAGDGGGVDRLLIGSIPMGRRQQAPPIRIPWPLKE